MPTNILLVDDDNEFRESICELLVDEGFEMATAVNGRLALDKIYSQKFDLILLDINMPVMSGKELFEHMHELDVSIPTVMISGWGIDEIQNYFMDKGAVGFLNKPIKRKRLLTLVNNLMSMAKLYEFKWEGMNIKFDICRYIPKYHSFSVPQRMFTDKLLEIIAIHIFDNQFSVSYIANKVGCSKSKFSELINEFYNKTPNEFLLLIRINMIQTLIENKLISFTEVSSKVGYCNKRYFKTVFDKYVF